MPSSPPAHFQRDPSLSADIADQFGGGTGHAEELQRANELRFTEELVAAQLLPAETGQPEDKRRREHWEDGELRYSDDDVAKAAELDDEQLVAWDVHGNYVVYAFEAADGRIGKDVLLVEDGELSLPEREDTPERAALRAQAEATHAIRNAKDKAEEIIAEARAKAEKLLGKAAAAASDEADEKAENAQARERQHPEGPGNPRAGRQSRSPAAKKK